MNNPYYVIKVNDQYLGSDGNLVWSKSEAINFHCMDLKPARAEARQLRRNFGGTVKLIPANQGETE